MTPQHLANPESYLVSASRYSHIPNQNPTGYKTQDLSHTKIQNHNTITPGKQPKWQESASTRHTNEKQSRIEHKIIGQNQCKLKEEMEYVDHLRKILKHLQDTATLLENNRINNKQIYIKNLQQMTATKHQLQLKQLLLQEQFQQLRHMLQWKEQNI